MTYVPLPIVEADVDDLVLDLDNYRIPTRPEDESAALNYLFAEEDVLGAAKLILRDGYFDNEVPIVIETGAAKYVVLEGNRRVSALKGLLDPEAAPSHAPELRALLKRYAVEAADLPTAIRVLIAPSREAANPHIARLHTTIPKKRWSRDQQANYYYSLLVGSTTVDDLKADYPDVDVVRFIRMVGMRRFLTGIAYSDPSLHAYAAGPGLTMSAFEYAYRNAAIATAIGVSFGADGHLLPRGHRPEAIGSSLDDQKRAAVEHLMTEFRAKRLNTRSAEFKKGSTANQALIDKLTGAAGRMDDEQADETSEASDTDGKGSEEDSTGSSKGGTGSSSDGGSRSGSGSRGPNHPETKSTLSLSGLDYTSHTSENLQFRYHELRKLSLKETPVAAALLLRSVLETTIKYHFEGSSTPATGQLTETIKVVVAAYGKEKSLRHSINQVQSGGAGVPGSVQWFNLASHSADLRVMAAQVREAFGLIEPLLRRLLRPRTDPTE